MQNGTYDFMYIAFISFGKFFLPISGRNKRVQEVLLFLLSNVQDGCTSPLMLNYKIIMLYLFGWFLKQESDKELTTYSFLNSFEVSFWFFFYLREIKSYPNEGVIGL